jgi:hypothetical protein
VERSVHNHEIASSRIRDVVGNTHLATVIDTGGAEGAEEVADGPDDLVVIGLEPEPAIPPERVVVVDESHEVAADLTPVERPVPLGLQAVEQRLRTCLPSDDLAELEYLSEDPRRQAQSRSTRFLRRITAGPRVAGEFRYPLSPASLPTCGRGSESSP